jgi:hypothetical protein
LAREAAGLAGFFALSFGLGLGLGFAFGVAVARATSSRRPAMRAFSRLVFMTHVTSLSFDSSHFSKYGHAFSGAAAAATLQP